MKRTVTKRALGKHGPTVSSIGLGAMGMSDLYGKADRAESVATIRAALDAGINLIDTGDFYGSGHNELLIREALAGRTRESVVLSVKFGVLRDPAGGWGGIDNSPAALKNSLAQTTAYEVSQFGIETCIVMPGPFTQGTEHFPDATRRADTVTSAAYARLDSMVARNEEATSSLFTPGVDANPQAVADEYVRLVSMPAGTRPFRTEVDFSNANVEAAGSVSHTDGFRQSAAPGDHALKPDPLNSHIYTQQERERKEIGGER